MLLIPDTGEIRHYTKAMKELNINKMKDKREADSVLSIHIPVRVSTVNSNNNGLYCK